MIVSDGASPTPRTEALSSFQYHLILRECCARLLPRSTIRMARIGLDTLLREAGSGPVLDMRHERDALHVWFSASPDFTPMTAARIASRWLSDYVIAK